MYIFAAFGPLQLETQEFSNYSINPIHHGYLLNVKSAQDPTLGATMEAEMSKANDFE